MKRYLVGGAVRDALLGVRSKDLDYAVEAPSWEAMREWILEQGMEIFLEKPTMNIIRARNGREVADYVMCRQDGPYSDGRHPDWVKPGTIYDDLRRRDFTVNAIAQDVETGEYLDPWDGRQDLEDGWLRAVGSAEERLQEDPLRAFRALRFAITKNLHISAELDNALRSGYGDMASVSTERIREEVHKMFKADTAGSMALLLSYRRYLDVIVNRGIWFKATTEDK
jgi:tRNA nucleotidyltransferase (CCA-adding enzyme)